ncbi:peptide chain release factor aRF-1 [Candidatus Woesearchaeota archaeon]|nr:peptide chain release factor aRF-1 [Candidatus Woesearchaeota archaeon]
MQRISAKEKYHLKHFVKEVEAVRGRHTELITVYIPAGYDINQKIQQLQQEQGTATNIKSKSTRDNVIASLEKMVQHLKTFKNTPPHGLIAFSGNAAEQEGRQDYRVWSVEPPIPLKQNLYRCDKEFVVEPLKEMIDDKIIFGLVAMDKREGTIALLKGKTIIPLKNLNSAVPGKHKTGGQSAQRFERLREGAAIEFYKRIAQHMLEEFLENQTAIQGIIVGGPGHTKHDFVEGGYITDQLKRKIIGIKDLSYTGEFGLQELLEKSEDILADEEVMQEKIIMRTFFEKLATQTDKVAYGFDDVLRLTNMGAVETIVVSEALDEKNIDEIEEAAELVGTTVEVISTETREGVQLKDMGKVGAILRYAAE